MKVEIHQIDFVYRFRYMDQEGFEVVYDFTAHEPIVEFILGSLVFILIGRPLEFTDRLRLEYSSNGVAEVCVGELPPTSVGLADDANPQRRMFLSAVSALLELAELQQAQLA